MNLQLYLNRIGYRGRVACNLTTFRGVHRAHAEALTYENLDVQLGVPVTRDPAASFDKIVRRGRGGWCYEMNGLLGWALEEIGFEVTRLAGGVMREQLGDFAVGNHLVLLVRIDGADWIGDVGFGDGLIEPAPLREGPTHGNPFDCRLELVEDKWWRYFNDPKTGGPGFDFRPQRASETLLEEKCRFLQTDPLSPFVQNAVLQRWKDGAHLSLRGRVMRRLTPDTEQKRLVESAADYVKTIKEEFSIDFPEAASLWPSICERHEALFAGRDPFGAAPLVAVDEIRAIIDGASSHR